MLIFRIRDYSCVLLYRFIGQFLFKDIGKGVRIIFPIRIVGSLYIEFGDNVTLQYGAYVAVIANERSPLLRIGNGTMIGHHSHIICTRKIVIGEKVLIADKVYISDNSHSYENVNLAVIDQPLIQLKDVEIGDGSWIGENVCIAGVSIGKNCVIGANSLVTKDIPDNTVAVGSPAKPVKRYCFDTKNWKKTDPTGKFIE